MPVLCQLAPKICDADGRLFVPADGPAVRVYMNTIPSDVATSSGGPGETATDPIVVFRITDATWPERSNMLRAPDTVTLTAMIYTPTPNAVDTLDIITLILQAFDDPRANVHYDNPVFVSEEITDDDVPYGGQSVVSFPGIPYADLVSE